MLETELNDAENEPGEQGSAQTAGAVVNTQAPSTPAAEPALTTEPAPPADPADTVLAEVPSVPAVPPFGAETPNPDSAQRRPATGVASAGFSAAEPPAQAAPAAFLAPQLIFQAPEVVAAESAATGTGTAD